MRLGDYELLSELGRGGTGVVHRARAPSGRDVAIKVLKIADESKLARFERERRLLASFTEEDGFVPLLDSGSAQGVPYLVMPFMSGGTLRTRLEAGPLSVADTVALGLELASALASAHERGVVHRDLKPENVLFTAEGKPLIADLGLAKHFDLLVAGASASAMLSLRGEMRRAARTRTVLNAPRGDRAGNAGLLSA